ncbi:hypothetical protein LCGC14_2299830 [marine sediment metagenome]|uniref:Xylose isomerase-like TIM barrel domain-containing protein n=1 Tax=marine sediment metagenome TaxID=412755 RepID=A0A0F9DBB8_9ZZZZ
MKVGCQLIVFGAQVRGDPESVLGEVAAAGYDGYVAIEYEGKEDEATGVPASTEYMKKVLAAL